MSLLEFLLQNILAILGPVLTGILLIALPNQIVSFYKEEMQEARDYIWHSKLQTDFNRFLNFAIRDLEVLEKIPIDPKDPFADPGAFEVDIPRTPNVSSAFLTDLTENLETYNKIKKDYYGLARDIRIIGFCVIIIGALQFVQYFNQIHLVTEFLYAVLFIDIAALGHRTYIITSKATIIRNYSEKYEEANLR